MKLAERIIATQRNNLRKANNARFENNGFEYRIIYNGGLSEFMAIFGRPVGKRNFHYIKGFPAYKMHNKEEVIAEAMRLVCK